ncbi:MAG TPA: hypothetical protein VHP99_13480, partial [Pyrinomonadaceae bacterium]|nr:hypothetical protein [Pyrinomonadaceae bacterium]
GATPRPRIKKFTGLAENWVGLSSQYLLALPGGRVTALRRFIIHAKVPGEAFDVSLRHLHPLINRTAVRRTL